MQEISHYSYKFNCEMRRLLRETINPNLIPVENTTEKVHISIEKESEIDICLEINKRTKEIRK